MTPHELYALAADATLVIHGLFVVFLVLGLFLIYLGKLLSWQWVRNPWFRVAHLLGISVVVIQSWFAIVCPLTTWEMGLRLRAGEAVYVGSFVANWVSELLYFQAPPWAFVVCYTVFGALVLSSWFLVRPRPF
tara:strand:- start:245 stop:643 length:399 start_codon:yes stop_codon:yes gene_type:complete